MYKLVIANKNYSSWSLRAWLVLTEFAIPFEEIKLALSSEDFRREIVKYSPAAKVPILVDGTFAVWDSLAIIEYLAERLTDRPIWPRDPYQRAHARSICAEMHAGFSALRANLPMNVSASLPGLGWNLAVQRDVGRIVAMWGELLDRHGGPMLFGEFSAADAFFAPVASRFSTYAIALPAAQKAYCQRLLERPGMLAWAAAAREEETFLAEDEPYRLAP